MQEKLEKEWIQQKVMKIIDVVHNLSFLLQWCENISDEAFILCIFYVMKRNLFVQIMFWSLNTSSKKSNETKGTYKYECYLLQKGFPFNVCILWDMALLSLQKKQLYAF